MIDNMPAVRAFVEQRIKSLSELKMITDTGEAAKSAALDELNMILTLCDGIEHQSVMLQAAIDSSQ